MGFKIGWLTWEQRKFGEIYDKIRNAFVGTATPYYVNQGHFYLESNNVKYGKLNFNNEVYINDDFYQKQKPNWLHTGDLVVVQSGHVGHSAVIPSELNNTAAHAVIIVAKPKQKIDSYFINDYLQTNIARKQIDNIATGNTIKHILASAMKMFEVSLPSYEEQRPISNLLAQIDDTITLQQHKLDQLNTLKKGLLQKMFADKKHPQPELRFKGFSGDWEQQKLKTVVNRVTRKNVNNESNLPLTISAQDGLIAQDHFFGKKVASQNLQNYLLLKKGDFAYNKSYSNGYPFGSIKRLNKYKEGVISSLYIAFKPKQADSDYLEQFFDSDKWHREIYSRAAEGARNHGLLNISPNDFFDADVKLPSSNEEQKMIGDILKKVSEIITLQQKQIDKLNSLKKSLLQNMFI